MVKLYVDHEKLTDMSNFLSDNAMKMDALIEKMLTTVDSISNSWDGLDAQIFIANASEYIENLKLIQNGLVSYSARMIKNENRYAQAFLDYFSRFDKEDL